MFYALGLGLGVALGVAVFTYLGMGLLENTRGPSQQYTYERRRPSTNQQQQRPRRRRYHYYLFMYTIQICIGYSELRTHSKIMSNYSITVLILYSLYTPLSIAMQLIRNSFKLYETIPFQGTCRLRQDLHDLLGRQPQRLDENLVRTLLPCELHAESGQQRLPQLPQRHLRSEIRLFSCANLISPGG